MADSFTIKRGDTAPSISATLTDDTGVAINLTGATVAFEMKPYDQTDRDDYPYTVQAAANIDDAAGGVVSYDWSAADTNVSGRYRAEFVVTFAGGEIRSIPSPGFITVNVVGSV